MQKSREQLWIRSDSVIIYCNHVRMWSCFQSRVLSLLWAHAAYDTLRAFALQCLSYGHIFLFAMHGPHAMAHSNFLGWEVKYCSVSSLIKIQGSILPSLSHNYFKMWTDVQAHWFHVWYPCKFHCEFFSWHLCLNGQQEASIVPKLKFWVLSIPTIDDSYADCNKRHTSAHKNSVPRGNTLPTW